jgi:hypothetical protein
VTGQGIWFSEGIDRELLIKLSTYNPEFDKLTAELGDKTLFQTEIDKDYVAIGRTEVGILDRERCIHKHIVLLRAEDYPRDIVVPRFFWNNGFIDYKTFVTRKYNSMDKLTLPLQVDYSPDPPPQLDALPSFFGGNKDTLARVLNDVCLLAIPEPKNIAVELSSMDEGLDFLFFILSLLPPELRPYVSFLVGMQPKQGGQFFNLQVRIGQTNRFSASKDVIIPPYEIAVSLAAAALDRANEANDRIKHYHDLFQEIREEKSKDLKGLDGRHLNDESLKVWPNIKQMYIDRVNKAVIDDDPEKVKKWITTAREGMFEADERRALADVSYGTLLERAKSLYKKEEKGEIEKAINLVQKMKNAWGEKDELTRLGREIDFLAYVRNKDVANALKLFAPDQALDYIERLLGLEMINYEEVKPLFSAREKDFEKLLNSTVRQRTLMEFGRYQWNRDNLESLTEDSLRRDRGLVRKLIESAEKRVEMYKQRKKTPAEAQNDSTAGSPPQAGTNSEVKGLDSDSYRNGLILDIANTLHRLMGFETHREMELLRNWRTEDESLFYIFPRVLLEFQSAVDNAVFQYLLTKYIEQVIDGMGRKATGDTVIAGSWEFAFTPADLYRVYFNLLKHRIQDMQPDTQKAVTVSDERYSEIAQKLKEIETKLSKTTVGPTRPISRPENQVAQPRHDVSSTQSRVLDRVFKDEKMFLRALKDNPDGIRQKISDITPGEQARQVSRCIKGIKFDERREMENLVVDVYKKKSLFYILQGVILDLGAKVDPGEFEELVTMYINWVLKGMGHESKKGGMLGVKPKTEFPFSPNQLYTNYSKELESRIEEMIRRKRAAQSDGEAFSHAAHELHATISQLKQDQERGATKNG